MGESGPIESVVLLDNKDLSLTRLVTKKFSLLPVMFPNGVSSEETQEEVLFLPELKSH